MKTPITKDTVPSTSFASVQATVEEGAYVGVKTLGLICDGCCKDAPLRCRLSRQKILARPRID